MRWNFALFSDRVRWSFRLIYWFYISSSFLFCETYPLVRYTVGENDWLPYYFKINSLFPKIACILKFLAVDLEFANLFA